MASGPVAGEEPSIQDLWERLILRRRRARRHGRVLGYWSARHGRVLGHWPIFGYWRVLGHWPIFGYRRVLGYWPVFRYRRVLGY